MSTAFMRCNTTEMQQCTLNSLRQMWFSQDWWNAVTIGDYWRLWNMPVSA